MKSQPYSNHRSTARQLFSGAEQRAHRRVFQGALDALAIDGVADKAERVLAHSSERVLVGVTFLRAEEKCCLHLSSDVAINGKRLELFIPEGGL